jgi:hypothetical protein
MKEEDEEGVKVEKVGNFFFLSKVDTSIKLYT